VKLEKRSSFGWPATAAGSAPCKNGLVVHYDGSNLGLAGKPHTSCQAYWKATRKFHMGPARGWLDIGYSFGVCPHGIVMEGRGWQRQQAAQPGGNATWTSCTFMSGDAEKPTAVQIEAFRELRSWLRGKGLAAAISYHSRFISTSCPGKILRGMVSSGALAGAPAKPSAPPAASAPPWPGRLLENRSPMMHGADVLAWQRQMRARGWGLTADGYYGPASSSICRAFQKDKHLGVDGVVGAKTWAAAWSAPVT
jgi:Putative peptidoglycan binding domain